MRILASLLFIFFLCACKKDSEDQKVDIHQNPKLSSITYNLNGQTFRQNFSYYANSLVEKIVVEQWPISKDSTYSQPYYNMDFTWNGDKTLSNVKYTQSPTGTVFIKDFAKAPQHQLIRKGFFPPCNALSAESWLGFDMQGRVVADSASPGVATLAVERYILYSWDVNDNLIREDQYIKDGSMYTNNYSVLYTYDKYKNPLYTSAPFFFAFNVAENYQYQCKNNLLEEKVIYKGDTAVRNSYSYQYDTDGYPVKRTLAWNNGISITTVDFRYVK